MDNDTENIKNPAYVGVNPRFTKNLGNYESLQVGVLVTLPCANTPDAIQATITKAGELAMTEMEKNFAAFAG